MVGPDVPPGPRYLFDSQKQFLLKHLVAGKLVLLNVDDNDADLEFRNIR